MPVRYLLVAAPLVLFYSLSALAKEGNSEASPDIRIEQCQRANVDPQQLLPLLEKPLHALNEAEVDVYLRWLQAAEPDLRRRVVHLARKNLGQPYDLYLLGEMPFETYDPQPIYCLDRSDCLVFTEHTYAMSLGGDWPQFMSLLQRIRYRDGRIGVATRNHYTEADWNVSNRWLVRDITAEVAGDAVRTFSQQIDRAKFLQKRYGLETAIPVEQHDDVFLPYEEIARAEPVLREGDFVNIVRGNPGSGGAENQIFGGSAWVGHVGLVMRGEEGGLHLIHSTRPRVREEPLDEYIANANKTRAEKLAAGKPVLLGFKFLRLRDDPLAELRKIDGDDAPRVTLPKGGAAQF